MATRINATQCVLAALALLNVSMVGAGAYLLSALPENREAVAAIERSTKEAERRSAKLAERVLGGKKDPQALVTAVHALDAEHVDYQLAGVVDGDLKVLASSRLAELGKAPTGAVLQALKAKPPAAEIALSAPHTPGSTYTAYFVAGTPEGQSGGAPMAPAPQKPPPGKALRQIKRMVKQQEHVPASLYTIKKGDTLYKIARAHYGGDESMVAKIWQRNRGVLGRRQADLPVGVSLHLPAGLGRTIEIEETVLVYPHQSVVVARQAHAAAAPVPTRVALRLSLPIKGRELPAFGPGHQRGLALGIFGALIAGLSWWLAALMLSKQRRRQVEEQRQAQLGLLGERLTPQWPELDRSSLRSPWEVEFSGAIVAGDELGGSCIDVRKLSDARLGLFIGDATGWNTNALVSRGLANAMWRSRAADNVPPAQTLVEVNRLLVEYIPQGEHITACYAQVDLLSGSVTYASAAHTGAYVLGRQGELTLLPGRSMPLGVGCELFGDRLEESHVRLQEGEALLLITDGITKAEAADGSVFGLDRLATCLRDHPGADADTVVGAIRDALAEFVGTEALEDESAMLCLRLVSPPVSYQRRVPQAPVEEQLNA